MTGIDFGYDPQVSRMYSSPASDHRVKDCSSRYCLLNDEIGDAIFIFMIKDFYIKFVLIIEHLGFEKWRNQIQ